MSIIGAYIDRVAGATLTGVTLTTYPHSLGTTPDMVLPVLKSANTATAPGALIAPGGNASLSTVGLQAASVALGSNMANFDIYSWFFHSIIR